MKKSIEELKQYLNNIIENNSWREEEEIQDDWNPMDASGGNFDDAYYLGKEMGYYMCAKRLLEEYL